MTLFFSVTFEGCKYRHGSTVEYFKDVSDDYEPHKDAMVNLCKSGLVKRLKVWKQEPHQIESAQFFFWKDGKEKEITFFEWRK